MIFLEKLHEMLAQKMQTEEISPSAIARCLGVTPQAISMKLSGQRRWKPEEMAAVRDLFRKKTGRDYTVDELFFAEEGAA